MLFNLKSTCGFFSHEIYFKIDYFYYEFDVLLDIICKYLKK